MKRTGIHVQALVYEPDLGHSHWVDAETRCRTVAGLVRYCNQRVKDGEWVGWRLFRYVEEMTGQLTPKGERGMIRLIEERAR